MSYINKKKLFKNYKRNLLLIFLLFCYTTNPKILIFTYSFNRPDFLETQYLTFKRFLKEEYDFIVFNDASDKILREKINQTSKKLNLKCIDIPQEIHYKGKYTKLNSLPLNNASIRNSNVVQWSLDHFGFKHNDILFLIDSDLFLTRPFSIRKHLENYDISAWLRTSFSSNNIKFLWIGLVFLNMNKIAGKKINFGCGYINEHLVDAGGFTYYFLKNYSDLKINEIKKNSLRDLHCAICKKNNSVSCPHNLVYLEKIGFDFNQIKLIEKLQIAPDGRDPEFFINGTFIHFRAGSNYNNINPKYLILKEKLFREYIQIILR